MQFVPFWYHTTFSGCKQHLSFFKYNSTVIKHDSWTMKATKWQIRPGIIRWMGPGQATNECKTSKHHYAPLSFGRLFLFLQRLIMATVQFMHLTWPSAAVSSSSWNKINKIQNQKKQSTWNFRQSPASICSLQNWNGSDRLWETCQSKQQNNALSRGEKLL